MPPEQLTDPQRHWQHFFLTGEAKPDAPEYIHKAAEIMANLTPEDLAEAEDADFDPVVDLIVAVAPEER